MAIGTPANTLAGASQTTGTAQALSIPAVTAGRIILIQSHGRRSSTTLAPGPPTVSDTSTVPLTWTACFSPLPTQVGVNPGTAAQWWWAVADGAAKTVTVTWPNAGTSVVCQSSVASFTIGAGMNPSFANQAFAGSTGAVNAAVTATFPTAPSTGINMLSFAGAGGSVSTIATGYVSLTNVASTPYRTGHDMTPGTNAVMGANFPDQLLAAVNIVEVAASAGGLAKVWTGSAWATKPAKAWSGSAWVQKPVKTWTGSAWKTTGGAGPTAPTTSILTAYTPGSDRNDFSGEIGVRLGIGGSPLTVSWIGARRHSSAQTGTKTVKLYEWFADALQATAVIDYTGVAVGSYAWKAISPVTLTASGYYALMFPVVASDGQTWCNPGATTFAASIVNVYDCYRIGAGALQTGSINSQFLGLDMGW